MEEAKIEVKKAGVIASYKTKCEKIRHKPNQTVINYLEEPSPQEEELNFIFRGNYKLHFNSRITDNDIITLAPSFKSYANDLINIDLSYNKISDEGGIAIAELLTLANNLRSFNIQGNDIEIEGAKAISKALFEKESVEYLNIYLNNIQTDGCMNMVIILLINMI